jgi:GNAT superfamily N-acetyltransferase
MSPLTITAINPTHAAEANRFIRFPFKVYAGCPQWTPPLFIDSKMQLNRQKHPFYEHSEAAFFLAERAGEVVGRIAVLENRPYNQAHGTQKANVYLFECLDDREAAHALFARAAEWAQPRGLDTLVGPKGFSILDGYGVLVEGFEHHQMMTMTNYNHAYYPALFESFGFEKEVDFVSCYIRRADFNLPERVHRIAERVLQRGALGVERFTSRQHLLAWADRIAEAYNQAFVSNWEYAPLTAREKQFVIDNLLKVADYRLVKIITHQNDAVGFLFAFPDVSAAFRRAKGQLFPFGIVDLLLEMKRTTWVAVNGMGILPQFQGHGGNALLYAEMEKTAKEAGFDFAHIELTQVAETAEQMRSDLVNLGGQPYKNHRVYRKAL